MFNRVPIRVEKRGVPIAERLMPHFAVFGETNVTSGNIELRIATGEDHERPFMSVAVVRFAVIGEVEEHRVVEHIPVGFGNRFETRDDRIDELHMLRPDGLANLQRREFSKTFSVSDIVQIYKLVLNSR